MTDAHPLPAKTIRIGRHPDNDIALRDLDVSRHHAELRRNPDEPSTSRLKSSVLAVSSPLNAD